MKRFVAVIMLLTFILLAGCTPANTGTTCTFNIGYILDTEEKYNEFIASYGDRLPESYMTWQQASELGSLSYIWVVDDSFTQLVYKITDSTNIEFSFYVDCKPHCYSVFGLDYDHDRALFVDESFASISGELGEIAHLNRGGFHYLYDVYGKIERIYWYKGDVNAEDGAEIEFGITGWFGSEGQYPSRFPDEIPTNSLVGRLLSYDDEVANAAFAEIMQKLAQ